MDRTEEQIRKAFQNATPDVLDHVMTEGYYEKGIVLPLEKKKFGSFLLRKILSSLITLLIIVAIIVLLIVILVPPSPILME